MNMVIKLFIGILAFLPFAEPLSAAIPNPFSKPAIPAPPALKILIAHDKPGVVLEVKGKYNVYDPKTNASLGVRYLGKRKYIQALNDGLQWGEEFPGIHQILIVPDSKKVTTIVDGIEYRGSIYVYSIQGLLSIVNEVDIEDFLQSMLAPQSKDNHHPETLAAIAIAARTNAYFLKQNPKSPFWAVDGSKIGYQGYAVTNLDSPLEPAIEATRYLMMTSGLTQEGMAIPFAAYWPEQGKPLSQPAVPAQLTLKDADEMAKKGDNAAHILAKAFPNTSVVLMYSTPK